jgi:hypothetical protein
MRPAVLLLLVLLALLWATPSARAETAAGIVMEISGETSPPLSEMAEIPADTLVQLQPNTKLTFLHYARCKLVTVIGGTVTLTRTDYKEDGKVLSEADGPCPQVYALPDSSQGRSTAGIISRGLPTPLRWPVNPEIIFAGARANTVTAAAILTDEQPNQPLQLVLTGARAKAPQGAPSLQPGGHYTLRITMRDRPNPVDTPFIATTPGAVGTLVVLHID